MEIGEGLKAAGVRQPVTRLWFAEERASYAAIFAAIFAAGGMWIAWSFHIHPDQQVSGRSAWMGAGHGMLGFLFGLGLGGGCLWLLALALGRLATRHPAFEMTASGVEVSQLVGRPFGAAVQLAFPEIDCVKIERRASQRRFPFNLGRNPANLYLAIYRRAEPNAKPIQIWSRDLRGGYRRACRFADTLDRALALHRDGQL